MQQRMKGAKRVCGGVRGDDRVLVQNDCLLVCSDILRVSSGSSI